MTITIEFTPVKAKVAAVVTEVDTIMTNLHPVMANIAPIIKTALGLRTNGNKEADSEEYTDLFHFRRF